MAALPDGLLVVSKRDCPTCTLIEPVLGEIQAGNLSITAFTQDDPAFPSTVSKVIDDRDLERSYHLKIETVPTLIRVERGNEVNRIVGWNRAEWREFTGMANLGAELPEHRPGCGSRNV